MMGSGDEGGINRDEAISYVDVFKGEERGVGDGEQGGQIKKGKGGKRRKRGPENGLIDIVR